MPETSRIRRLTLMKPDTEERAVTYFTVGIRPPRQTLLGLRWITFRVTRVPQQRRVKARALNDVDEWGASDHCRLLIEVGSG